MIPKVFTKKDMLCHIAGLALNNNSPSESVVLNQENYAKQALMMFYPHRSINNLMLNNSFWSKFVEVDSVASCDPNSGISRSNNNPITAKISGK